MMWYADQVKRYRNWRIKRLRRKILDSTRRIGALTSRIELSDPLSGDGEALANERSRIWWKRNELYAKLLRLKEAH